MPGKSSCYFCPASKRHEIEELATEYPDLAVKIAAIEYRAETGKNGLQALNGLGLSDNPTQDELMDLLKMGEE